MKLIDKQIVEATKPTIYIGKRTYKSKRTGDIRIANPYWAEYFANGIPVSIEFVRFMLRKGESFL